MKWEKLMKKKKREFVKPDFTLVKIRLMCFGIISLVMEIDILKSPCPTCIGLSNWEEK